MTTFAQQHASERIHHNRRLARVREALDDVRDAMERAANVAREESLIGRRYDVADVMEAADGYLSDWRGVFFDLDEWEGN